MKVSFLAKKRSIDDEQEEFFDCNDKDLSKKKSNKTFLNRKIMLFFPLKRGKYFDSALSRVIIGLLDTKGLSKILSDKKIHHIFGHF